MAEGGFDKEMLDALQRGARSLLSQQGVDPDEASPDQVANAFNLILDMMQSDMPHIFNAKKKPWVSAELKGGTIAVTFHGPDEPRPGS